MNQNLKDISVTPQELILLLMSVLASVGGQFFLKAGALKLGRVHIGNAVSHILSIITTPELVLGLACYGLGALAYIMLLTRVSLSIADPSISQGYFILNIDTIWYSAAQILPDWIYHRV